ncbi:hypothetical protein SAY87_018268 [Trapa incisa]|uniref:AT3G52170-like helix-turn-helix domain-containing protein n=1 Tax=Trapa incisa TaxID=236973 RepID=A0AAN7QV40_9MYRT|nr:hypothetical protein SAY87_018268 [Trapa incisa]
MPTIKICWVGQTFALSKSNESGSGGRKSRTRLSKDERKAMVESFIKMYQNRNDGNFPSLNLTHKNVGGSFYTVREIFREIIQGNRVLGPAKLIPLEKRTIHEFPQQYHLDLMTIEPQVHFFMPSEECQTDVVSSVENVDGDEGWGLSEEMHNADKELQIFNENRVHIKNDEHVAVIDQSDIPTSEVIDLTSVEVETFPLISITKGADCLHETVGKGIDSSEIFNKQQTTKVNSSLAFEDSQPYGLNSPEMSSLEDDKVKENQTELLLHEDESSNIESNQAPNSSDTLIESSDMLMTEEGTIENPENGKSLIGEESLPFPLSPEGCKDNMEGTSAQAINEQNCVPSKSLSGALQNTVTPKSFQETEIKPEPDGPSNGKIHERNPTLDRISLETWEVSSRKSSGKEINPVMVIFKAFVTALTKFWSG